MNKKAVWFIAVVVGRREHGVWLLNRCWLLFKFNEVKKKKSKLIDYSRMQEHSQPKAEGLLECECLKGGPEHPHEHCIYGSMHFLHKKAVTSCFLGTLCQAISDV